MTETPAAQVGRGTTAPEALTGPVPTGGPEPHSAPAAGTDRTWAPEPDSASAATDLDRDSAAFDDRPDPRDWEWVEEWRASGEPVPWSLGVTMAVFTAVLVGSAVYVVTAGLSDRPLIAVIVDLAVAGGVAPAIWLSRKLPVLRWFALGGVLGIAAAWIGAFLFLV